MSEQNSEKKVKKKRISPRKVLIFVVILVIFIAILIQFFYYIDVSKIKEIKTFNMSLQVSDYIGINLDNESLTFGTVMPGSGARRYVNIDSSEPVFVIVKFKGDLSKWASVSENKFTFNGTKSLTFSVNVPSNAELGNYNGNVRIIFKKTE